MSFQAMAWASEQTTGSSARKLVLYALANHANSDGYCRLGYDVIAAESELSESGVKKAMTQLESLGFVRRARVRKANGHLGYYEFNLAIKVPGVSLDQVPGVSHKGLDLEQDQVQDQEQDLAATAASKKSRKPNPVWDALVNVVGFEPKGKRETGGFATTVADLRGLIPKDATPEQIEQAMRVRRRAFERAFEGATFTHHALCVRWTELGMLAGANGSTRPAAPFPAALLSADEFREWRRTATRDDMVRYQHEFDVDDHGAPLEGF